MKIVVFLLILINWVSAKSDEVCEDGVCVNVPRGASVDGKPREAEKDCKDRREACKGYASRGECEKNPGWMIVFCPESCNECCNGCELRNPKIRCDRERLEMSTEPIYEPGDMADMFNSIEERFGDRYGVEILSRDPFIVTFDNFVDDVEVDALIETNKNSFERSTDTGSMNEFGETGRILSKSRTSSNSWCRGACEDNPHVQRLMSKIAEVTNVPKENYESFQVLQYLEGQRYGVHHDYGASDRGLACGPRILTFFLYLSDVEEGGETAFPTLNIAVKPKKGKALLWPSTISEAPDQKEVRTNHEARPVIKGVKYAANSWIHLYNYEIPNLWGCTGTFDE